MKLTVNGINSTEENHSQEAEITVSSETVESKIAFEVSFYVRETLNIGSETIDVPSLHERYPYFQPLTASVLR